MTLFQIKAMEQSRLTVNTRLKQGSRCSSTCLHRRSIDDRVYGNRRRSHMSCSRCIGYASGTVGIETAPRISRQSRKPLSNTAARPWPTRSPLCSRICCAYTSNSPQCIRHRCCSAHSTLRNRFRFDADFINFKILHDEIQRNYFLSRREFLTFVLFHIRFLKKTGNININYYSCVMYP